MAKSKQKVKRGEDKRVDYSKISGTLPLPNLLEIQKSSYDWFINEGIIDAFNDIFPIVGPNETFILEFVKLKFEEPKNSLEQCRDRFLTYSRRMKATLRLTNNELGEIKDHEVYFGEMPLMTDSATFIISGNERVIIPQLSRSPGAYFSHTKDKNGKLIVVGEIHPIRGTWLAFESDTYGTLYTKIDRKIKLPASLFLRAIGLETNEQMMELFGDSEFLQNTFEKDKSTNSKEALIEIHAKIREGEPATEEGSRNLMFQSYFDVKRYDLAKAGRFKLRTKLSLYKQLRDKIIAEPLIDLNGEMIFDAGTLMNKKEIDHLKEMKFFENDLMNIENANHSVKLNVNKRIYANGEGEDVVQIVKVFTDDTHSKVVNIIGNDLVTNSRYLTIPDIIAAFSLFYNSFEGFGLNDDIDFLGNRRIKSPGELIQNEFRTGLAKLERAIKEKMSTSEANTLITAQSLINIRPLTQTIRQLFGHSQLIQFMDQTNPLSEIANKRRISALGPGGLNKDRAGVEVRDVHFSHYGRICPIETPEGGNIGLISNLSTYAKLDEYGFIQTPYRKINKETQQVLEEFEYLTAAEENDYKIAQANIEVDDKGFIKTDKVVARYRGENLLVDNDDVDYVDVSPKQLISISTACIPFLENDDAIRALMAANMQRQAVPLIIPDSPIVGTGVEAKIAHDSGNSLVSNNDGVVTYIDSKKIIIEEKDGEVEYELKKFSPSNQGTCLNHTPVVDVGQKVEKGEVLANGSSIHEGELALGKNVLVAFMTWDGYNYEDAIIMSDRLVKDDVYTSIHIQNYDIECRDTKLGPEEFTRDIPNVSEESKTQLDIRGVVIPGSEVKDGDILVGKITPKGQTEPKPEEKLLMAIFGEKTKEGKDQSLRIPNGGAGTVIDVKYFSRKNGDDLQPGINEMIRVYVAQKRKISEGDKMAGRHGNKGVISRIVPSEDMPFLPDGTPIDLLLNPLGVPSRMNIGQIVEMHVGYAAHKLGMKISSPVFDGISNEEIDELVRKAGLPEDGKSILYDGRTGEPYDGRIAVGMMYMLKLSHMIDDKLHARATGTYSLVTQQPLGGKAQNGGQRFGEMEVWALEAYGAAYTLQEMLTLKSDDIIGRNKAYVSIVNGRELPKAGVPEAFKVLLKELQSLGIEANVYDEDGEVVDMKAINKYQQRETRRIFDTIHSEEGLTLEPSQQDEEDVVDEDEEE